MNRQHFLQYAVQNRRASVRHQQADITLDAAISPDLIVNLPDRPHSENRSGDNHHVKQDIHAAEVVGRSLVNQQEQNFHHQTDEKIIRHEFPSGVEKSALPRLPVLLYLIHNSILSEKKAEAKPPIFPELSANEKPECIPAESRARTIRGSL